MAKHVPLTVELLEEGRFLAETNKKLRELQADMVRYIEEHGDSSKGAKGVLTLKISIISNGPDQIIGLKTERKTTMPSEPANMTYAIAEETAKGELALFVRATGSDTDSPKQTKLCTADGQTINPETGELMPE